MFKLKSIRKQEPQQPGILETEVDQFSVAGVVISLDLPEGKFIIQIQRNEKTPSGLEQDPAWQPFNLEIAGQLPDDAVGQFWELSCRRHSNQLVLETANPFVKVQRPTKKQKVDATDTPPISPTATPTADPDAATASTPGKLEVVVKMNQFPNDVRTVDKGWKEFSVNTGSCLVTITAKPKTFAALEQAQQTYPDWVAAISGQMGSDLGTGFRLESPAINVFERQPKDSLEPEQSTHSKSSLQGPTPGKLELTIKINEFPIDVRTFDNGWKQFDVGYGNRLVTIAVKPKVFKKLEQAQENYPHWVAAITGLRGETTDRGFVLLEPNIQLFERKPKESATAQTTHTKDNSEPSLNTNSQHLPPGETPETTPQQQSVALPKAEPQPEPSPVANPRQRPKEHLKQQRPTKTPKNLGQNQQRDQVIPVQNQPTASEPNTEPNSSPPRFTVTVNGMVIRGHDSVTLNKRLLCVDGVPVGQAKMVVVLGQPKTVQADGGVSQGRNQAVLISR